MFYLTDGGSLPNPKGFDEALFMEGLDLVENSIIYGTELNQPPVDYFSNAIVSCIKIKLKAGIEVPCYPQYLIPPQRDMALQFKRIYKKIMNSPIPLSDPFIKIKEKIIYNPKYTILPEVKILEQKAPGICKDLGIEKIKMKVCVSDFLTLQEVDDVFIASLLAGNIVNTKYLKTQLETLDAPDYGFSRYVDMGGDLLSRYGKIFEVVKLISPEVETAIHIHTSSQKDFLSVPSLDIIDLHKKHIESTGITREDLERNNKKLQVGAAKTSETDSVESLDTVVKTLEDAITKFGLDNIRYVSPECGMGGWYSEEMARRNLEVVAEAGREIRKRFA